jgi:hypothetical protein
MKRIVSTMPDGGVAITSPSPTIMRVMTMGGGYLPPSKRDIEIANQVRAGREERVTVRFIDALISGGLTDAEAYEVIRDRDVDPAYTAAELWDFDALPQDRWFRNAWKRSLNGGPIYVDMAKAKRIHGAKLLAAKRGRLKRLTAAEELERITGDSEKADGLLVQIDRVRGLRLDFDLSRAETPEQLRAVWPMELVAR